MKEITIRFSFANGYMEEDFIASLDSWINDSMNVTMADDMVYEVIEEEEGER